MKIILKQLKNIRCQIDLIDSQIIILLAQRFLFVRKIDKIKKKIGLPPLNKKRWQEVISTRLSWAKKLGLSQNFIKKLMEHIHEEALKIEKGEQK